MAHNTARTKALNIRVSEWEMGMLEAAAESEMLPVGTFMRRHMILEAMRRGIAPRPTEDMPSKAAAELTDA